MKPNKKVPAGKTSSAREKLVLADDFRDALSEVRRAQLRDNMSENLERIALWLPKLLEDEVALRASDNCFDPAKLVETYFGGFPLERVGFLRVGVNVLQIGLGSYGQADAETMHGFKKLVQACASGEIDMDARICSNPGWAQQMIEISFERPFNHAGAYRHLVAKPAAGKGPKPAL